MSYDAVLEQALEASQAKERELADQVAALRAKDLKRVKRVQALNQELAKAYNNIGELNSMLESVRRAHENQAKTIAEQGNTIHALNLEKASLYGVIKDLRRELRELNEDECDCAPNLALAACKKKMEQLEGMLEAQRRNTRELGVNLQRVRDERTQLRADRDMWKERAGTAEALKEQWIQAEATANDLEAAKKRTDRATSLIRRAEAILNPVKVTGVESTYTPPIPEWEAAILRTPAKKAEPRKCEASFPGVHGGHRCERTGDEHGRTQHLTQHRCHCGWVWD